MCKEESLVSPPYITLCLRRLPKKITPKPKAQANAPLAVEKSSMSKVKWCYGLSSSVELLSSVVVWFRVGYEGWAWNLFLCSVGWGFDVI